MICAAFGRERGAGALRALTTAEVESLQLDAFELLWLDLARPSPAELALLDERFKLHPLALEDVVRQHQRPKVDEYESYYFVVLYAMRTGSLGHRLRTSELQVFWGEHFLLTLHAEEFPELVDLASRLADGELRPLGGRHRQAVGVSDLMYRVADSVVDGYFPMVDAIAEWNEEIEERMFAEGTNRRTLQEIFALKKDLLQVRRVIAPSRDVLNVLLRRDLGVVDDDLLPYFQDVYDHTVRVIDSLDTSRDVLASATDIYLSLASHQVNQTVKRMTAVTAILMVLALVAGIYGMNFTFMPELTWEYGYPFALALMASLASGLLLIFRRIRWL